MKQKKLIVERLTLSKPYPTIKLCKDGNNLVFSLLSFYIRIGVR